MIYFNPAAAEKHPPIHQALTAAEDKKKTWIEMASAFVSAGIPLHVVRNPRLQTWIKTSVKNGDSMPSETTLRTYLSSEGKADIIKTIELCRNQDVILIIDETQDFKTRKIINVLVSPAMSRQFRLILTEFASRCNAETIVQSTIKALQLIEVPLSQLVAFITDSAPYMLAAGRTLSQINSRCMHSTCWAHIVHLVSDEIRQSMKVTDRFIAKLKASLIKSATRQQELLDKLEKCGFPRVLPPIPIHTRWTSWLKAGSHHFQKFEALRQWIDETRDDSAAVKELKSIIGNGELISQLKKIDQIYVGMNSSIRRLEGMNILASDVFLLLQTTRALFFECFGECSEKFDKYLEGEDSHPALDFWEEVRFCDPKKFLLNPTNALPKSLNRFSVSPIPIQELTTYRMLCNQITEESTLEPIKFWKLYEKDMPLLSKLCLSALSIPPSSSEVERSFSALKKLMRPERNRFTEENLGIHLRIQFNNRHLEEELEKTEDETDVDSETD